MKRNKRSYCHIGSFDSIFNIIHCNKSSFWFSRFHLRDLVDIILQNRVHIHLEYNIL